MRDGVDVIPLVLVVNALADPRSPEAAASEAVAVVAMGDGVVAGAPGALSSESPAAIPGGWVTVLADCLQERAPQRFSVVDRAIAGDTVRSARDRIPGVRELAPAWVILALGAHELAGEHVDAKKLGKELEALVGELREKRTGVEAPQVLLVGIVSPTLAQVAGPPPPAGGVGAASPPPDRSAGDPPGGAGDAPADRGADAPPGRGADDPSPTQAELDQRAAGWNRILTSIASPGQGIVHLDLWSDWPKDGPARGALTANGWSLSDQGHAKIAASVCDAVLAGRP